MPPFPAPIFATESHSIATVDTDLSSVACGVRCHCLWSSASLHFCLVNYVLRHFLRELDPTVAIVTFVTVSVANNSILIIQAQFNSIYAIQFELFGLNS